jgi:glycosyltransferase involved in cell wall biosynthesis
MATAIIVDPSLWNYAGHHLTAVAGWVEVCRSADLNCRILANKECSLGAAGAVAVEKCFRGIFYDVAPEDPSDARMRLRRMQRQFRDDMADSLKRIQSDDVVILAHATLVTLNGVADWAYGLPRKSLPRLIVWLMTQPDDEDFVAPFGSTDCMATAIDRLRKTFGDRLSLTGFTDKVCRRWEELTSEKMDVLPFASLRPELPGREGHVASSPPVIGFFGHLGPRKGLTLLPGIIRELDRRKVEVQWRIAGECFDKESTAFLEMESLARNRSNVSFADGPSGLDDYGRLLTTVDLLLLPYSPSYYEERGSGISEEAELVGLPYVAPKVAFSAGAVAAGAAMPFERWSVEGIADAIAVAVSNLPDLTRAAEAHSGNVRKRMESCRSGFLSPLLRGTLDGTFLEPERIASFAGVYLIAALRWRAILVSRRCQELSMRSIAEFCCVAGRSLRARWLVRAGERMLE